MFPLYSSFIKLIIIIDHKKILLAQNGKILTIRFIFYIVL